MRASTEPKYSQTRSRSFSPDTNDEERDGWAQSIFLKEFYRPPSLFARGGFVDDRSEHEISLRSSSDGLAVEIAILRISTVSSVRGENTRPCNDPHTPKKYENFSQKNSEPRDNRDDVLVGKGVLEADPLGIVLDRVPPDLGVLELVDKVAVEPLTDFLDR